jgi:hypothetical protein
MIRQRGLAILDSCTSTRFSGGRFHAEWEILDPGTAVAPNFTVPAPATSVVTAPATTVAAPTVATTERAGVTAK